MRLRVETVGGEVLYKISTSHVIPILYNQRSTELKLDMPTLHQQRPSIRRNHRTSHVPVPHTIDVRLSNIRSICNPPSRRLRHQCLERLLSRFFREMRPRICVHRPQSNNINSDGAQIESQMSGSACCRRGFDHARMRKRDASR